MKTYQNCLFSLIGCLGGLTIVHGMAYSMAINDKVHHATSRDAFWQAVFYDFLVGIPVASLCGWAVASFLRSRQPLARENGAEFPDS